MNVLKFDQKHLSSVNRWLKRNGHVELAMDQLSPVGFIVPGVAAGFIGRIEKINVAVMDGLVTNPLASSAARDKALDLIVTKLIEAVQLEGVKSIMAFSEQDAIHVRARKHGFVETNLKLLVR